MKKVNTLKSFISIQLVNYEEYSLNKNEIKRRQIILYNLYYVINKKQKYSTNAKKKKKFNYIDTNKKINVQNIRYICHTTLILYEL